MLSRNSVPGTDVGKCDYVRCREERESRSYRYGSLEVSRAGDRPGDRWRERICQIAGRINRRSEKDDRNAADDHQRPCRRSRRVVISQPSQLPKFQKAPQKD